MRRRPSGRRSRRSWRRAAIVAGASSCRRPRRSRASSRPLPIWRQRSARWRAIRCRRRSRCACSRRPGRRRAVDDLAQRLRTTAGRRRRSVRPAVAGASARRRSRWCACVGLALARVLIVAAALTVATVVRLALHARRDEIEIMQLVGAPAGLRPRAVRRGGRAAGRHRRRGRAPAALAVTYLLLRGRYLTPLAAAMNLSSVEVSVARPVPAAARRRHAGRLSRRLSWRAAEPDRYKILTRVFAQVYTGFNWSLILISEDLHATLRDRLEADQRAAPDHRVLPRGIRQAPSLSSAAATIFFGKRHYGC